VATAICCSFGVDEMMKNILNLAKWYRSREGGVGRLESEMRIRFLELLPDDAVDRVRGRLYVAIVPLNPAKRVMDRFE